MHKLKQGTKSTTVTDTTPNQQTSAHNLRIHTIRVDTIEDTILDNEISRDFKEHLSSINLPFQLVSPGDHRANPAERAIQTFKNHFIAMLSGTDPDFPTNC